MSFNRTAAAVTSTTNTGLGDDQFSALQTNQGNMGTQLEEGFGGVGTRFNQVDTGITGIQTDLGNVATDVNVNTNTGFSDLGTTLSGYNDATNLRLNQFDQNFANNSAALGANNTALTSLQGDVTGGFGDQATRFNQVDAANTAMQGDITTGFSDQAQGFTDAQTDRTTNAGLNAQGFVDTGAALNSGFVDTTTQLGGLSTDVVDSQANMATSLDNLNTGFNSYATQSAEDQASIRANQESFVSNFDAYTERYAEDTTLANQTRTDMQTANANSANKMREDFGAFADNTSTQIGNITKGLDNQFSALEGTVEGGFSKAQATALANNAAQTNAASDLQASLRGGGGTVGVEQIVAARNMAAIASTQADISMELRQNFNQLGSSFDDAGSLIASSLDAQGNTINRTMDQQGNLILNRFDGAGVSQGQKIININNTLTDLSNLNTRVGSNSTMGNLTAASSRELPSTGFTAPFATTR